jgi:hypothetical protein
VNLLVLLMQELLSFQNGRSALGVFVDGVVRGSIVRTVFMSCDMNAIDELHPNS